MELKARQLKDSDWETLTAWWDSWPDWVSPSKDFLPDNGTGGLMIQKNNKPIVAGFLYFTNSKSVLLEWIISDPKYKDNDRQEAVELLIKTAEKVCKDADKKYMFSIGRNKNLMKIHEKIGWNIDKTASYEIVKKIA
ncbi:MAG: hypothetical protein CMO46_00470 [Verrucomicrobiales bacterium]|nr:hypothetical protein [Verrucomicrobiales bacterium]|tara:strand:- start:2179 stop:2589 length:411 start_codon:yes stop_codon:yes gene_type:complete